jgi:hypothetical protein
MSLSSIKKYGEQVGEQMIFCAQKECEALMKKLEPRIAELGARIAHLEARKSIEYRGTWRSDREFGEGDLVTHAGQLFICKGHGVRSKPGSSVDWVLASKKDLP